MVRIMLQQLQCNVFMLSYRGWAAFLESRLKPEFIVLLCVYCVSTCIFFELLTIKYVYSVSSSSDNASSSSSSPLSFPFLPFFPPSFDGLLGTLSHSVLSYLNELAHFSVSKFSVMELVMGSLHNKVSLRMLRFAFLFPIFYIKVSAQSFCVYTCIF